MAVALSTYSETIQPIEAPVVETPIVETPTPETPVVEATVEENESNFSFDEVVETPTPETPTPETPIFNFDEEITKTKTVS